MIFPKNFLNAVDQVYAEKTGIIYPVSAAVGNKTEPEPTVEVAAPVIDIQLHCDPDTGDCTVVGDITCETEGATIMWRYHSELEDLGEILTFQNTQYPDYEEYNIEGIEAEDYQAWFSGTGLVEAYAVLNGSTSETSSVELPIQTNEEQEAVVSFENAVLTVNLEDYNFVADITTENVPSGWLGWFSVSDTDTIVFTENDIVNGQVVVNVTGYLYNLPGVTGNGHLALFNGEASPENIIYEDLEVPFTLINNTL